MTILLQVGIAMVGISSLQSGSSSASHPVSEWQMLAGMALIVASQVHQHESAI